MTEGAHIGTSVLHVSAHDKDLGLNGEVRIDLFAVSVLNYLCYDEGTFCEITILPGAKPFLPQNIVEAVQGTVPPASDGDNIIGAENIDSV